MKSQLVLALLGMARCILDSYLDGSTVSSTDELVDNDADVPALLKEFGTTTPAPTPYPGECNSFCTPEICYGSICTGCPFCAPDWKAPPPTPAPPNCHWTCSLHDETPCKEMADLCDECPQCWGSETGEEGLLQEMGDVRIGWNPFTCEWSCDSAILPGALNFNARRLQLRCCDEFHSKGDRFMSLYPFKLFSPTPRVGTVFLYCKAIVSCDVWFYLQSILDSFLDAKVTG